MTPDDLTAMFTHLGLAYPAAKAEPATSLAWLQHFNETPVDVASEALHRWIGREKWPPTIAEFRIECSAVARDRYLSEQADLEPLALPPGDEDQAEVARDVRRAFVLACRESLALGKAGASAEKIEATFMAAAPKRYVTEPVTYPCRCLGGKGWIFGADGSVRPCAGCRPEMYERWDARKLEPHGGW